MSLVVHWRNTLRDSDLDRTAKLVGFVLSTYMDGRGVAWCSKTTIARGASLGHNPGDNPGQRRGNTAVDAAIDRLEASELLIVDRKRGRRGFTYGAAIPRRAEGFKSHADARDNGVEIPRGWDAKSHAELAEIPRHAVGESAESAESVSTRAAHAEKKSARSRAANVDLSAYDR